MTGPVPLDAGHAGAWGPPGGHPGWSLQARNREAIAEAALFGIWEPRGRQPRPSQPATLTKLWGDLLALERLSLVAPDAGWQVHGVDGSWYAFEAPGERALRVRVHSDTTGRGAVRLSDVTAEHTLAAAWAEEAQDGDETAIILLADMFFPLPRVQITPALELVLPPPQGLQVTALHAWEWLDVLSEAGATVGSGKPGRGSGKGEPVEVETKGGKGEGAAATRRKGAARIPLTVGRELHDFVREWGY